MSSISFAFLALSSSPSLLLLPIPARYNSFLSTIENIGQLVSQSLLRLCFCQLVTSNFVISASPSQFLCVLISFSYLGVCPCLAMVLVYLLLSIFKVPSPTSNSVIPSLVFLGSFCYFSPTVILSFSFSVRHYRTVSYYTICTHFPQ